MNAILPDLDPVEGETASRRLHPTAPDVEFWGSSAIFGHMTARMQNRRTKHLHRHHSRDRSGFRPHTVHIKQGFQPVGAEHQQQAGSG
jgi:hypothetical protein